MHCTCTSQAYVSLFVHTSIMNISSPPLLIRHLALLSSSSFKKDKNKRKGAFSHTYVHVVIPTGLEDPYFIILFQISEGARSAAGIGMKERKDKNKT